MYEMANNIILIILDSPIANMAIPDFLFYIFLLLPWEIFRNFA